MTSTEAYNLLQGIRTLKELGALRILLFLDAHPGEEFNTQALRKVMGRGYEGTVHYLTWLTDRGLLEIKWYKGLKGGPQWRYSIHQNGKDFLQKRFDGCKTI